MLLFIMSASCYRSAGYGGDSDINTELPPQPRPAAEVCLAGVPLRTLVPRLDIETNLVWLVTTDGHCR